MEIITPSDVQLVDVLVDAEVRFATSGGDYGRVRASLYPDERSEEGTLQPIRMIPHEGYALGSAGLPPEESFISASWRLDDVAAEGESYTVELWGVAIDGDGDQQAEIAGEGDSARVHVEPTSD